MKTSDVTSSWCFLHPGSGNNHGLRSDSRLVRTKGRRRGGRRRRKNEREGQEKKEKGGGMR
jgi:hypothetical protein